MNNLKLQEQINNISFTFDESILSQTSIAESNPNVPIYYISDLHLVHHLDVSQNLQKQIRLILKNLFPNNLVEYLINGNANRNFFLPFRPIIVFCGDVCSNKEISTIFYHEYKLRYYYYHYLSWRKRNPYFSNEPNTASIDSDTLLLNLKKQRSLLKKWFEYTPQHEKMSFYELETFINNNNFPPRII